MNDTAGPKNNIPNNLINGDSIVVLTDLVSKKEFFDIIMIDPPYNENKSSGKYQDIWKGSGKEFSWAGPKHGSYLDFLLPRISLGRDLLSEAGVMMLFIGDGEQPFVRFLMNQVFGEENYIGTVIWDSNSNQQKSKPIDRNHEYVLIFSKNIKVFSKLGLYRIKGESFGSQLLEKAQSLKENGKTFSENELEYYSFYKKIAKKAKDEKVSLGNYKYITPSYDVFNCGDAGAPDGKNRPKTQLLHPITKEKTPVPRDGKGWAYSQDYLDRIASSENITVLHDGRVFVNEVHDKVDEIKGIIFGKDESGVPNAARAYSIKTDKKVLPTTGWSFKGEKKEGIDPKIGFETVKPAEFLSELILNYPNKKARILDYFAGSGSTAVAVDQANKQDSGERAWTMVELSKTTIETVLIPKLTHFKIINYTREEK